MGSRVSVVFKSSCRSRIMWFDKYDADEYLNKQEAENFLSEVITEFYDRRKSDIELKDLSLAGALVVLVSAFFFVCMICRVSLFDNRLKEMEAEFKTKYNMNSLKTEARQEFEKFKSFGQLRQGFWELGAAGEDCFHTCVPVT